MTEADRPLPNPATLADALVTALDFLELSDDRAVDPDAAVAVMEDIVAVLADASAAEKRALLEVVARRRHDALGRARVRPAG